MGLYYLEAARTVTLMLAVCLLTRAFYRVYYHPLRNFPGPLLASISRIYEFYFDVIQGGMYMRNIEQLHRKYGPIVRISPNHLHVSDPYFYDEVYASGGRKRDKDPGSVGMYGSPYSMISAINHDRHRYRRGLINSFFSKKSLQEIEPNVKVSQEKLFARFNELHDQGATLDLDLAFSALTTDVITEYLYGLNFNFLGDSSFRNDVRDAFNELSSVVHVNRFFPGLALMLDKAPQWFVAWIKPATAALHEMQNAIIAKAQEEMTMITSNTLEQGKYARTIFSALSDPSVLPSERTIYHLRDEAQIALVAGTETTSKVLSIAIFYIYRDRKVLARLREELRQEMPLPTSQISWAQGERLPYLTAVIKESVRLSTGPVARTPRVATDQSLRYQEYTIPQGTPISMTSLHILQNESIFPEPHKFLPERWIQAADRGENLERFMVAFNKGSRSCVGMGLAYLQIYTTLAYCLRRYDFELWDTTEENVETYRDFGVGRPRKGFFSVKVKLSNLVKF